MENRGAVKIAIVRLKNQAPGEAIIWRKARRGALPAGFHQPNRVVLNQLEVWVSRTSRLDQLGRSGIDPVD
jgi:hypothetical protein